MIAFLAALAVAAGALAQSVSGIGFVLVAGPLLVALLGPDDGVRLGVTLSIPINLVVAGRERRHIAWRDAVLLAVPAVIATPLIAWATRGLGDEAAAVSAGAAAVAGAAALASGVRWSAARGRIGAAGAGVVSATMNVLAGIGGPAAALWAANAGWSAAKARATLQPYFLALNVVALASLGLPEVSLAVGLGCGAALLLGLAGGATVAGRVPDAPARRITLLLAAAGGLAVALDALLG